MQAGLLSAARQSASTITTTRPPPPPLLRSSAPPLLLLLLLSLLLRLPPDVAMASHEHALEKGRATHPASLLPTMKDAPPDAGTRHLDHCQAPSPPQAH